MAENISRSDIVAELYSEFNSVNGLSKALLNRLVSAYENRIIDHVAAGDKVSLAGFLKADAVLRPARTGRNPRTGEQMEIKEKRVPRVAPLKAFRDTVALEEH